MPRNRRWSAVVAWFALTGMVTAAPSLPECPAGWQIELVAQAPQIRHPSVVCVAPDGRVFVAEDPMDITAPANAAQGRIICFHPDGRRTVFAERLYAVFGMQYLEGRLYVLHNPKLSVFTDDDGVGRDRVDLIESTHPKPWALDWNDHVPANFRLGMDGYFYVAVGDKGVYGAIGRDGRRVDLRGGGILRLRPDGTELEVHCTGVRNILDVALNAEDDLFTYDNTDEHDWMGRLTHMAEAGFYGYPHDFVPRRPYTLWMMADFGAGAATGAFANTEDALPAEYADNLFLADFGKRQVLRVQIERDGATYRVTAHEEFFKNPPEDFRPVGIAPTADGLGIYLCDWQHRDTKGKVEVGRLWRVRFTGESRAASKPDWFVPAAMGRPFAATTTQLIEALSHPAKAVRLSAQRQLARRKDVQPLARLLRSADAPAHARWHALWALDAIDGGESARADIVAATGDQDASVRRQAIRQLGTRRAKEAAYALQERLRDGDAAVRFQAATALGRIGEMAAVSSLLAALAEPDFFARYAVFTALNRLGRARPDLWPQIVTALDHGDTRLREGAEFALRETYDVALVTALASLVRDRQRSVAAREAALRLIAALHHQVPEWKGEWWAYHPALAAPLARIANWPGTAAVLAALRQALDEPEARHRLAAVDGLRGAAETNAAARLHELFRQEKDIAVRAAILQALAGFKDEAAAGLVAAVLRDDQAEHRVAIEAARAAGLIGGTEIVGTLLKTLGRSGIDPAVQTNVIEALAKLKVPDAVPMLTALARENSSAARSAAIRAIGRIGGDAAAPALRRLLTNADAATARRETVTALGELRSRDAVPDLLNAWKSTETRAEALAALARVSDARALEAYLDGLASANPTVRDQCRKALRPVRDEVLAELESRATTLKPEVRAELRRVYDNHPGAKQGPLFAPGRGALEPEDYERHTLQQTGDPVRGQRLFFDELGVACVKCHAVGGHGGTAGPDLTLAGVQFARLALIEHLLYPSRSVREGYQQVLVETRDGESFAGVVRTETGETLTLMNAEGRLIAIPKQNITRRSTSAISLMPEGLHAGLSLEQFADLIAYLESRRTDPRQSRSEAPPDGFEPIFNGHDLAGWRAGADIAAHWKVRDGVLEHDGVAGDLWTEREFGDFEWRLEWRWPDAPRWEQFPVINRDGVEVKGPDGRPQTERVLDAGDSGVFLRGFRKAQANLFCYPVGSGEVWEYRTDPAMPDDVRRGVTPSRQADKPLGDWNRMEIVVRGERLTVILNGEEVITNARLPGLPARGPLGFQHEHGRIQFRNVWARALP